MNAGKIIDTTLRDGEQGVDICFSRRDKLEIARLLDQVGVEVLEVGIPAMGESEREDIQAICNEGLRAEISTWCRANRGDLKAARALGCTGVHVSFPVSAIHLKVWNKDRLWIRRELQELVKEAKDHFEWISIGAQDASRAESDFLIELSARCEELGVRRLRIADTVGVWTPRRTRETFSKLRSHLSQLELEFHAHNDLGMATANAVTALEFGATHVSTTVNGIGERSGNAALEEVIMSLYMTEGEVPWQLSWLKQLSRVVERASGRKVNEYKSVVGERIFDCESGIHCAGLSRDRLSYESIQPEWINARPGQFVTGRHSGSQGIMESLRREGLQLDRDEAAKLGKICSELTRLAEESPESLAWLSEWIENKYTRERAQERA